MKEKKVCLFLFILAFVVGIFWCTSVEAVTSYTVGRDEEKSLSYELNKVGIEYLWSIEDETIAIITSQKTTTVSFFGTGKTIYGVDIRGKKEGSTNLYLKDKSGNIISQAKIIVNVPIKSIITSETKWEMQVGDEKVITTVIKPIDATDKTLIWKSSNENVASVDQNGKIIAKAIGTTNITVSSIDEKAKTIIEVNVLKFVTSFQIQEEEVNLSVNNRQYQLNYSIQPIDATNKKIKWTSSDENVATVTQDGKIIANSNGTATIK